jgi:RNA polymerase sigma factor (TIGR02999 family)
MSLKRQEPASAPSPSAALHDAGSDLTASLYNELHRLAAAKMRFERGNHTLQPTALVNEAYMRLADCGESVWQDRPRLMGAAAHMMRNILVDHARARHAGKRGDGALQVTLDSGMAIAGGSTVNVLAVDEALTRLAALDPRQAAILEMYFFAGLTMEEIALQLGVSTRTVKRDSTMARAWMHEQLAPAR